jgi:tRNA dimethylallyltransferase
MLAAPFQNALVLTGPTGSGKSALGVELAMRLDAEIVSMDSMALYRGMDIGTAKPTAEQRRRVPHHLVDALDPSESASVAWWLKRAEAACRQIEARGKQVLFVGGTPLYLKALLFGLFDGPPADPALRDRLAREAETLGPAGLHARLAAADPVAAERIHPNDVRRLIRALEVLELTGRPISAWQQQWPEKADPSLPNADAEPPAVLWLDLPRPELYDRINHRVDAMFAEGLIDEVRRLRGLDRPLSPEARQALGYKEVFDCLDGKSTPAEAREIIKTRSRNFAKRQITWFRHLPGCRPASKELTEQLWKPKMKG